MEVFHGIGGDKLGEILHGIKNVRIALIGDICLDVYWEADMRKSELSRETPHFPLPVVRERMYPGGGGNAAANIAALRPKSFQLIGVIGKDWRGDVLSRKFKETGINTDTIVVSNKAVTNAYIKPIRKGISQVAYEDPRLDFCNYEDLLREDEEKLMEALEQCSRDADVLCVSDQLLHGCITPEIRERILGLAKEGLKVIVDSRDRIGMYKGVTLKPNEVEGTKAVYSHSAPEGTKAACNHVPSGEMTIEEYARAAKILAGRNQSKVYMTLGSKGCLYVDSQTVTYVPSYDVKPPIDIWRSRGYFFLGLCVRAGSGSRAQGSSVRGQHGGGRNHKKAGHYRNCKPGRDKSQAKRFFALFKSFD